MKLSLRLFRSAILLGALAEALAGGPLRAAHREPRDQGRKNPKIVLSATPAFGFPPLSVQLVATLSGVGDRDANFCHAGVTWIRVDPGSAPETGTKLTEAPRCVHGEEEVSVVTSFSKTFDLYSPGAYLYRLVVEAKDGTQIRSNFVKVQVMRVP
jgi:hypothetical protein